MVGRKRNKIKVKENDTIMEEVEGRSVDECVVKLAEKRGLTVKDADDETMGVVEEATSGRR